MFSRHDKENTMKHHDINVLDSRMHYVQAGDGAQTLLFLHGMPTSSYLWRHVLPHLADRGICIAPDLIGMGKSGKPSIQYTFRDHARYLEAFINALDLTNVMLVMHGWGSIVGMQYAMANPENISGMVFCEAHIRPLESWDMLALPIQELASLLKDPKKAYQAIVRDNYFMDALLPHCVMRDLSDAEIAAYKAPFSRPGDRLLLWQYVQELPLGQVDSPVTDLIARYTDWLAGSSIPKLILYAMPGFATSVSSVSWALAHWSNTMAIDLPDALHLAQESCPHLFVDAVIDWLDTLDKKEVSDDAL